MLKSIRFKSVFIVQKNFLRVCNNDLTNIACTTVTGLEIGTPKNAIIGFPRVSLEIVVICESRS